MIAPFRFGGAYATEKGQYQRCHIRFLQVTPNHQRRHIQEAGNLRVLS